MTPAARLEAARVVLADWLDGMPAERALAHWARGARYAGSKDRRAVRDHVYDMLRQRGVCAHLGGGEDARALILGLARLSGWGPELFSGEGYGPAALTAPEAAMFAKPAMPERHRDTPAWLRSILTRDRADWPQIEAAFCARAPVYLRVNLAKTTRAAARTSLAGDGLETRDAPCATALEVTEGAPRLTQSTAYQTGLVEPQDLSVQQALALVDWPQGRVLDYCAGGGGKALAIADRTGQPVDIHDADPGRMADAPIRAKRAGVELCPVARPAPDYDVVLTDVPCSGSGTWRRDPEAKWRLTPARLEAVLALQTDILDAAAGLAGRVIYMTCSLLEAENEAQVRAFLKRHSGWRCLQEQIFTPLNASDGFYMAELCFGEN